MALKYSVAVRNARLDAIETTVGTSAILKIRTGAPPANCAAADSGTVLSTVNLPSDWMAAAASGEKLKSGTWEDTSADATGTAAHFRIYASGGSPCHIQGRLMAVPKNLVWEQSSGTGTGNKPLVRYGGFARVSEAFGTGDAGSANPILFFANKDATSAEWEGVQGYMSDANTFVPVTRLDSSNGGSAVTFTTGL